MKYYFLLSVLFILGLVPAFAQIGIGTTTPAPSAALEVSSTDNDKGILIPRISAAQKDAIVNPAEGLLIYQITAPVGFYYYAGTSWKWIANATDLATVGNAATATKLATPRNINGVAFDGSADITVPAVTSISALTLGTSGIDLSSTVANGTTTPVITLNVPTASGTNRGALSSADWTTFNGKQNTITLTTTGTSGAAIFASNTINIPNYGSTFSGYVPYKGATDSVNLGAYDLTVNSLRVGRGGGGIATNTAIGNAPLFANTTGSRNTAIGNNSLYTNTVGYNNTAIGANALFANIDGDLNTATGISALEDNTTGNSNTATGTFALGDNTSGSSNTAIGQGALRKNTTATYNTAIGFNSLNANLDGYNNTATGVNALAANTSGYFNTATGVNALGANTSGLSNTATGLFALGANTTGGINTAIGHGALRFNSTGSYNTAIGYNALNNTNPTTALTGSSNTAIGYLAGTFNTTGTYNTFIGNGATASLNNLTNATAIGNGASASASNTITLGNGSIATLRAQVTSITALSDRRDKTDISTLSEGLEFIKKLKPVSFTWNTRDKAKVGIKSAGFIAQDLLALQQKSAIGNNLDLVSQENPDKLEARYSNLLPVIVKAIQQESAQKDSDIAVLKAVLTQALQEQQKAIQSQQKQIEELKLLILSLKK